MNYVKITNYDIANGEGVRLVLWVSGCDHHCYNCHNPETWNSNYGNRFNISTMIEILDRLKPDYINGLTLSGGDPLKPENVATVYWVVSEVKKRYPDKTIWCWTGYTFEELISRMDVKQLLSKIDVLVDGEYVDSMNDISLKWRGSSNQRVIDVKRSLQAGKVVLYCD